MNKQLAQSIGYKGLCYADQITFQKGAGRPKKLTKEDIMQAYLEGAEEALKHIQKLLAEKVL